MSLDIANPKSFSGQYIAYWLSQGKAIVIKGYFVNGFYRNEVSYE